MLKYVLCMIDFHLMKYMCLVFELHAVTNSVVKNFKKFMHVTRCQLQILFFLVVIMHQFHVFLPILFTNDKGGEDVCIYFCSVLTFTATTKSSNS